MRAVSGKAASPPPVRSASQPWCRPETGAAVSLEYRREGALHHAALLADDGQVLDEETLETRDAAAAWWAERQDYLRRKGFVRMLP